MATLAMFFRRPLAAPAAASGAAQSAFVAGGHPLLSCGRCPTRTSSCTRSPSTISRMVREPHPAARGEWRMIGTACAVAVLFMGLLTPRVANIFAGYQLESLKQEQQPLARRTARSGYRGSAAVAAGESRRPSRSGATLSTPTAPTDRAPRSQGRRQAGSEPALISNPQGWTLWNPSREIEPANV